MKIKLNNNALYRLMRERKIETISQLIKESGINNLCLYGAVNRDVTSKETYWQLAKFFGCHIEDLQVPDETFKEEF